MSGDRPYSAAVALKRVRLAVSAACVLATASATGMRVDRGLVWLEGMDGRPLVGVGPVKFNGQGNVRATVSHVSTNDSRTLTLALDVERNPEARLGLRVRDLGDRYELDYRLAAPSNFSVWGVQGTLRCARGVAKGEAVEKHGIWNRCAVDPLNGEPYEAPNVKIKRIGDPRGALWYVVGGDENWCGGASEHFPFNAASGGVRRCRVTLHKARGDEEGWEVAARHAGRPFALSLTTERRNNLFDSGVPQAVFRVANVGPTNATADARLIARDWDGNTPFDKTERISLRTGERHSSAARLPAGERGIWFIEGAVGVGLFARTTVAFLPPHEFRCRDKSIFGMVNGTDRRFKREKAEEMALLARMGVHWLRGGHDWDLMTRHGIESIGKVAFSPKLKRAYDPASESDRQMVSNCVDALIGRHVRYAEMGNEIGHFADNATRRDLFAKYVTWLDAYRAERARRGGTFKIVYGTSSYRPELMRVMEEFGVWRKLDEYVIHPARGYWTADKDAGGWRYLGLIRGTRRILRDEMGISEPHFHLTEVYAKTKPNDGWADSYRQSAENILLTAALAVSEPGVRSFTVHKLHEGISFDDNGIDPGNMEYHYGLLHRDNAPKPSFMGYVTAAEELDGATFNRWIFRDARDDKLRGLVYNTPRGPLALLWDRAEGFKLTDHAPVKRVCGAPFFHWEPWHDHWRVKKPRTFKAAGPSVTVVDCIGRRRTVPAREGRVTLVLDGGPRFVWGLDLSEFADEGPHERQHAAGDIDSNDKANRE
ncbi:MAG: hypothetical protein IJL17_13405 [Kiritimatiellae bacterium]|nr:hypothetical protein [Kiritimatiellia bacterium]